MTDPILYWNEVALEANRSDFTTLNIAETEQGGPTLSSRALAIVHLAMYDAYAGAVAPPLPFYNTALSAPPPPVSPDAAVAAAAHATLSALYPRQKAFFDSKLAQAPLSPPALIEGSNWGRLVAEKLLDARKNDPNAGAAGYIPLLTPGGHRPDPDNPDQGFHAPFYGERATVFATTHKWEISPPPAMTSVEYLTSLRQVRAKGIAPELMGTLPAGFAPAPRDVDQSLIGVYWGYDGAFGLGTPPRLYNQIVRKVAIAKGNDVAKNARLFALINAAMGDAGIMAWREKYRYNFWRPVVGIREFDKSMGAMGVGSNDIANDCDPGWLPFGAPNTNKLGKNFTPPFPAYPSGHATFGAAAFHMTRLFYGIPVGNKNADTLFDNLDFVSDECNGISKDTKGAVRPHHVRNFPKGLWQMIEENGFSRVYLGVHWSFDAFALDGAGKPDLTKKTGGVPLGLKVAEDIFTDGLKLKGAVTPQMI